jgi:hypothetical protein
MDSEIRSLYSRLKEEVSVDNLKEISSDIIHAYKTRNYPLLQRYASCVGLDVASTEKNRLFSRLIQTYHPDKFNLINLEIDNYFKKNDFEALKQYMRIFTLDWRSRPIAFEYSEDYDIDTEDIERFGMGVVGAEYFSNQEDTDSESTAETDFYEAVKRELSGELAYTLSPFDLNSLEGELDLSYYGISNIEGIGHCANITSLNLSGNRIIDLRPLSDLANIESLFLSENRISDIESLGSLTGLRELDISFNDIEKADALLGLENLKYVNLTGNRIEDEELVQNLRKRNTIVII